MARPFVAKQSTLPSWSLPLLRSFFTRAGGCTSRGCRAAHLPASLGIRSCACPSTIITARSATTRERVARRVGTTQLERSALVVSHHLDGFLHVRLPGLLHPGNGHEVRCVSKRHALPRPESQNGRNMPLFPATRFTPFEELPRQQPYRITAAFAFLTLPPVSPLVPPACADMCPGCPKHHESMHTMNDAPGSPTNPKACLADRPSSHGRTIRLRTTWRT
mgnify:FL=1